VSFLLPQNDADQSPSEIIIRAIEPRDDDAVARRLTELSITGSDPLRTQVAVSQIYAAPRCAYFVMERDDLIVGGAGIAPLTSGFGHIAELQRFVLLPMCGQRGHARRLLDHCLDAASAIGFRACYVESNSMEAETNDLLAVAGFKRLGLPFRDPTNVGCDTYHFLTLSAR
jgi:putative acetyltransferase